jgi:hypothetical protein
MEHVIAILALYVVVAAVLLIVDHIFCDGETRKSWERDDV